MRKQAELIESTDWDWLVICDGGRADTFESMQLPLYLGGEYERVWNGEVAFTANWFDHCFSGEYPDTTLFHGGQPIYSFKQNPSGYDEREHFGQIPNYQRYAWGADQPQTCSPDSVTSVVKAELPDVNQGVIRYLQPHNPYRNLTPICGQNDAWQYSDSQLKSAYKDNFKWVFKHIVDDLLPRIDGTVVITSDHGQCLQDCGQVLHSPDHDKHRHLVEVPWLEIDA